MTADHPTCHLLRACMLATAAMASMLLAAGCGGSGPAAGSSHNRDTASAASTGQVSDTARETAESRLETIGTKLATVLADYRSGRKQRAYALAKSISTNLYEGTTEGIVAKMDPAGERQIDPLLAATLPAAIQNGEPVSQIAALTHQAQMLARDCLDTIHHQE